jgi:hypothetical protein
LRLELRLPAGWLPLLLLLLLLLKCFLQALSQGYHILQPYSGLWYCCGALFFVLLLLLTFSLQAVSQGHHILQPLLALHADCALQGAACTRHCSWH